MYSKKRSTSWNIRLNIKLLLLVVYMLDKVFILFEFSGKFSYSDWIKLYKSVENLYSLTTVNRLSRWTSKFSYYFELDFHILPSILLSNLRTTQIQTIWNSLVICAENDIIANFTLLLWTLKRSDILPLVSPCFEWVSLFPCGVRGFLDIVVLFVLHPSWKCPTKKKLRSSRTLTKIRWVKFVTHKARITRWMGDSLVFSASGWSRFAACFALTYLNSVCLDS